MASSDLDLLDPDEYFSDHDRRAQERRERRTQKRHRKTPGVRVRERKRHSESLASTPAGRVLIGAVGVLASLLALFAVHFAHIDGRTDELSTYLATVNPNISLQGIVLAGMIVGALGVLADIAVTQASAVMVLRRADPSLTPRGLYKAAFHVGRDHLSATIHTLVLAYAGASLPLLLITHSTGVGFADAISTQEIAQPIIATLVGCIALVCAVPLTTGLAALLVARVPARPASDIDGGPSH